jgi:class 3 adenylate cyclase/tetratricopeptide (TPR) repeat protein
MWGRSIRCPTCEANNKMEARFCASCGTQLGIACGSCGFINEVRDRFCAGCGNDLASISRASTRRAVEAGELKRVSILFADIKGSTASIEGLDPEAALDQLEPALQIMIRLVNRYGGTLCRRLGDGVLAVFGAPIAHEDHAVRACLAAVGMQRELRDAGMADMIRVGINSGDILYRTISSGLGLEIDVVGPAVHMAARMEHLAQPGSVFMTGETEALAQGLIETKDVGRHEIKGFSAPIDVYEAVGASPNRSRWLATTGRDRAPFVGRIAERATLAVALEKLDRRRGGVIGIRGEAGFGKSRLVHDTVGQSIADNTHRTIFSGATPFGGDVPYHTLILALRDLLGVSENDDAADFPGIVAAVLGRLDPALAVLAPVLSSLIAPSTASTEWLAMDPRHKRGAVREACQRLAKVVAGRTPLAFVIEDIHWIDRESEGVLQAIAGITIDAPLLLVLTYRPEYNDSWLDSVGGTRLHTPPLTDDDVRVSLREWFVEGPETERLIESLASRVGGSPLFVEECVRSLANADALTIEIDGGSGTQLVRRRYACSKAPEAITLPPSVGDVIASRIDRRSPNCLALLHTLAVIDRPIPQWLADGICGHMAVDSAAILHEAVSADLLIEASISPEVEYDFAHAVLREVAHDALTRPRRTEAHRDVFSLIESRYSGRLEGQSEWLAHHAVLGELWDQSGRYQGYAAERAIARGSYDEAIAGFRSALRSYERSTRSDAATERAIDQLGTLRGLLAATGVASEEANAALAQAEQLARGINDRVRLAWVWADQSAQAWVAGENVAAIAKGRASLEIARQAGDLRLRALASARLGTALHTVGDFVEAAERLRDCRSILSGDLRLARVGTTPTTSIMAGGFLVSTLCELGLYDEAERTVNDVIEIAASTRDVYSVGSAEVTRCILAVARGDVGAAIPPLETLRAAAKAAGAMQILQIIEVMLGRAKLIAGDIAGALDLLMSTGESSAQYRGSVDRLKQVWFAEASAANGAASEAHAILDSVEVEAADHAEASTVVHCWVTRAKIARAVGDMVKAEAAFGRALQGASALSMRPVCAMCEAGLAAISPPGANVPNAPTTTT